MVLNRSRRTNAGNLMAKLLTGKEIEKKEGDEVYDELWGGFKDVENDHNFEVTAADNMDADDDSNSELDEQDSNDEMEEDEEGGDGELGEDGEPKRKKRKHAKSNWLLSKMSETTVDENILSSHEQQQRMAQCKKIAERNRQSLEQIKQKQLEEQKKNVVRTRGRHLPGPKEVWFSDKNMTYMLIPEVKQWLPPKIPKSKKQRH